MPAMKQNTSHLFVNTPSRFFASVSKLVFVWYRMYQIYVSPACLETMAKTNWEVSKVKSLAIVRSD